MVMRLGEVCGKSLFSAPFRGEPKTALNKVFLKKREMEICANVTCAAVSIHVPLPSLHSISCKRQANYTVL